MQDIIFAAFFDEMEKIAASYRIAGHLKARSGIRPIRAATLLAKDSALAAQQHQGPSHTDAGPGQGELAGEGAHAPQLGPTETAEGEKMAASERTERVVGGFARARPYAVSAIEGAVPTALVGSMLFGPRAGKIGAGLGAGLGVTNQVLKDWAEKHKRKAVARKFLEG